MVLGGKSKRRLHGLYSISLACTLFIKTQNISQQFQFQHVSRKHQRSTRGPEWALSIQIGAGASGLEFWSVVV